MLDCGRRGSNPEPSSLESSVRLRLSHLWFRIGSKCLVVTLKVLRTEWTVVLFVVRYYDDIIATVRRPSWWVTVFRHHLVPVLVLCEPASQIWWWGHTTRGNPYMVLPSERFNSTGSSWFDIHTMNLILSDTFWDLLCGMKNSYWRVETSGQHLHIFPFTDPPFSLRRSGSMNLRLGKTTLPLVQR